MKTPCYLANAVFLDPASIRNLGADPVIGPLLMAKGIFSVVDPEVTYYPDILIIYQHTTHWTISLSWWATLQSIILYVFTSIRSSMVRVLGPVRILRNLVMYTLKKAPWIFIHLKGPNVAFLHP